MTVNERAVSLQARLQELYAFSATASTVFRAFQALAAIEEALTDAADARCEACARIADEEARGYRRSASVLENMGATAAERMPKGTKAFPVNYWDALSEAEVAEFSGLKNGLHANLAETSAVMAINPDLVDLDKAVPEFPPFPEFTVPNIGAVHSAFFFSNPGSVHWATKSGTWGDPRKATAQAGERYLQAGVRSTLALLDNIERTFAAMPPR